MTTTMLTLSSPQLHIRSAYGTIAGSLRDHVLTPGERTHRALVDACPSRSVADELLRQAKNVTHGAATDEEARDALDRALGL